MKTKIDDSNKDHINKVDLKQLIIQAELLLRQAFRAGFRAGLTIGRTQARRRMGYFTSEEDALKAAAATRKLHDQAKLTRRRGDDDDFPELLRG